MPSNVLALLIPFVLLIFVQVKRSLASSVTFRVTATKVGVISIKVTATAQDGARTDITDMVDRKLIVKVFWFFTCLFIINGTKKVPLWA